MTVIPVSSVSISGGSFSLKAGASKRLSATVAPANATDRAVSWKSSDTSVATVDASGNVKAVKAGTATITATAGGKSASVTVTVTAGSPSQVSTVYYKPSKAPKQAPLLWYRVDGGAARSVRMSSSCDGWYSVKLTVAQGAKLKLVFEVDGVMDNNGKSNGVANGYVGSGAVLAVSAGKLSSTAPSCGSLSSTTVYYRPTVASLSAPSLWYRVDGGSSRKAAMSLACDGWYSASVQASASAKLKLVFEVNGVMDNNGMTNGVTNGYVGSGSTIAVSNGNVLTGVIPNCAVRK